MAILTSARQARAMGNALRLLAKDPSLDHGQRRTIMSARREFSRTVYPRLIRQPLTALDPVSAEPVPVTRPLVLEVDVAWLPAMEHTPGIMRMIEIDFPETIRRVVESRGVTLPNLLIRPNYDLVRNGYRILINETPVGDGVLAPDERYCEDATEGRSLGFTGRVWRNPTEDIDGMWLEPAEWERAERAGIPLLDPYQYMMLHLESAVRARLSAFVGFQEVWDTVRLGSWADEEERLTFIERTLPDTTAKVRLLQVLRRLVDERIPVNSVRPILSAFADFNPGHPDINELAEEVRSALRASDSDPAKPTKLIGFSTAVEDRIAAWVRTANDKSFLAVPREDMESFDGLADEVSYRITDNPVPSVAITVHQRDLRRHVWQFWRGALQVLAEEELDEASVPLIDRIERIT
jgi:flagellar biosynthesis component FlhA